MDSVEQVLTKNVMLAFDQLLDKNAVSNREPLLGLLYTRLSADKAQSLANAQLPPDVQNGLDQIRADYSTRMARFDKEQGTDGRSKFASLLARGQPIPAAFKSQLEGIALEGIRMVRAPETVRREVLHSADHTPDGWIRTPSIVISQGQEAMSQYVGGHNLAGRATRVELDSSIPKGTAQASGSYDQGRVLRLNPADKNSASDAVRAFDREVGLDDGNQIKGVRAVETRLRDISAVPRPVRLVADALGAPSARTARGASPSINARQVGYRVEEIKLGARPDVEAMINDSTADVIVAPSPPGYVVVSPRPAPPKTISAPNSTSMHEAVDLAVRQVSLGPPVMAQPKVAFHSMGRTDALRQLQSIVDRGKAVTDAGGKPPFGGDRNLFGLADPPDPERPVTYSLMERNSPSPKYERTRMEKFWDSMLSIAGKRRQTIHSEAAKASAEYVVKPNWSEAKIRFPRSEDTLVVGVPSNPGYMHIVEVEVPVTISARQQSIFVRAMSWFKDAPTAAKSLKMESSITKIFQTSTRIDVEEAFIQYKTLMIEQHGATNVQINLSREGNDIIVVDLNADASNRG